MTNSLQIFENTAFGSVRTLTEGGKVLFCGSDVAKALGYKNTPDALKRHCKGIVKRDTLTAKGQQEMLFIPEGDIYRLAARSDLPGAERFESWIFDEVLPAIRKTGTYSVPQTLPQALRLAADMAEQNHALAERIEHDRPKVAFADAVAVSETAILICELAKLIHQSGADMGQNRLFGWMRDHGYLMNRGERRNLPTQRAMGMGLFEIKERAVTVPGGIPRTTLTPMVTGKGQQYFINKFCPHITSLKENAQ